MVKVIEMDLMGTGIIIEMVAGMIMKGMPFRITIINREVMGIAISSNVIFVRGGATSDPSTPVLII